MNNEIGSEFWVDRNNLPEDSIEIPYWLNRFGNVVLTTSGRGAISLLLKQIKPKTKKVLLPSYICDSVISPFKNAGYELTYYDVDRYFRPNNIESIKNSDIGIFLHMGYFGFLTNEGISNAISSLKSKSIIVIEDVTHTLFSYRIKSIDNDFVIGSIRKWFGTPSGGFLASHRNIDCELFDSANYFLSLRETSLHRKFEYLKSGDETLKSIYLLGFKRAEQILDEDIKPYKIDRNSEMIIKSIDNKQLESSRKRNYEFLLKQLNNVDGIEVIFNNLKIILLNVFLSI